jgi:hypothetical protein
MPAFVAEDGTGLSTATSYVSVAESDDYFLTHPYFSDVWDALGPPDKQRLLMMASTMLDNFIIWRGYVASGAQGLAWPRTGVIDNELREIASNVVPWKVKVATFELAVYLSKGDPFAVSSSTGIDSLKIDVIELKFTSSVQVAPVPAAALLALRGLGDYTLGNRVRKVLVG